MEGGSTGPGHSWFKSKPIGVLRRIFRLPVYLYRFHLGWLLGYRFLLLTHRGRKTGLLRQAVLEVVRYDPDTRESIVVSAWGEKADWYRNIRITPALEIRTGGERYTPVQRFLTPEESYAAIGEYERRHPLAVRIFARMFAYPRGGSEAERRAFVASMHFVAFRPQYQRPDTAA